MLEFVRELIGRKKVNVTEFIVSEKVDDTRVLIGKREKERGMGCRQKERWWFWKFVGA